MPLANLQLTPQFVQAVRDAVDIIEVASQATRLKKTGRNWSGLCPLHKEKSPSFSVDENQGLFYCFGCGAGGDAIKLHMLLSGDDFVVAVMERVLRQESLNLAQNILRLFRDLVHIRSKLRHVRILVDAKPLKTLPEFRLSVARHDKIPTWRQGARDH